MKPIVRELQSILLQKLNPGKIAVISGPGGVGKTHLIKTLDEKYKGLCQYVKAGDPNTMHLLLKDNNHLLGAKTGKKIFLFIDDAHKIPGIDKIIPRIKRNFPNLKVIITSDYPIDSPALNTIKQEYRLYSLTDKEYRQLNKGIKQRHQLEQRLIYGNYPKILKLKTNREKQKYLKDVFNGYLMENILTSGNTNKQTKIINLLRMIGYLIGHEIFYRELEKKLMMNRNTVERYLHRFNDLSVIHQLRGYKQNLKKEVGKHSAWYFLDNGLRNCIVNNFNALAFRDDTEVLWKNYLIAERIKKQQYLGMKVENFFWRTYDQQELDMVEKNNDNLHGFRFSWHKKKYTIPAAWRRGYPEATFQIITPDNYQEWIDQP
jgi:predicted AAA+ superfamily ATPase